MTHELLLLPGLNNTPAVFDKVTAALPDTVRHHALELPALDTVEALAEHVLDRAPERFWLAGFSFGGYVSMAILESAPARVQGLALVCSLPGADTPAQVVRRQSMIDRARDGHYEQDTLKVTAPFHPDSLQRPDLLAQRVEMVRHYGADRYIAHCQACMARVDRTRLLDGRHPVLLLTTSHDGVVPTSAVEALATSLQVARPEAPIDCARIEHAGHLLPLEQPEAMAHALARWVATRSAFQPGFDPGRAI